MSAYTYVRNTAVQPPAPLMPAESVIKALYFKDLIKWAPKQDANYEDLVTRGICLPFGKDYVIVSSFQQATDYSQGTMPTYTWTDPAPILYVRPASVTAGYARATPKVVDFDDTTLPSGIKILPDHLAKLSRALCDTIVSTIPVDEDVEEYETRSGRDGLALLPLLYQDMLDEIDGDAGDAIQAVITALFQAGPAELQADIVKRWFNNINDWNEVQEPHRVMPASVIAGMFLSCMRRCMATVEFKLLEQELKNLKATGDPLRVKKEILKVLSRNTAHGQHRC